MKVDDCLNKLRTSDPALFERVTGESKFAEYFDSLISLARRGEQFSTEKHGATVGRKRTPEYQSWLAMKNRCYQKSDPFYHRYGGRGIKVCAAWLGPGGFARFLNDVGPRPSLEHTLGRQENDGNYEPDNVKWETRDEQSANRSNNRLITYKDKTQTLTQWSRELGKNYRMLAGRLRRNWTVEAAFTM